MRKRGVMGSRVVSAADDGSARAGTLDRGLSILEFFVQVREAPASRVVDDLGVSRSAIYRILDTMRERGYLEINPASGKLRLGVGAAELGSRRPLHCTSLGKAYLSALHDEKKRSLIGELDLKRYTANTITDAAALEAEVAATKERGYAVDRVEVEEGVACLGAPVRDHRGLPVAAISIAGPAGESLQRRTE